MNLGNINRSLRLLFTATAFLSAFLLFLVQPMAAKALLPLFGGAPSVWLVSMVFFQFVLLLGYGYAHWVAGRSRKTGYAHLIVMLVGGVSLLAGLPKTPVDGPPAIGVLQALTLTVGMAFFVCSAHAPLLQKWYSRTDAPDRDRPYYLYAASNLGSFASLLLYPAVIEPRLDLTGQHLLWAGGFAILFLFVAACSTRPRDPEAVATVKVERSGKKEIGRWLLLSGVASVLLMGVINYLTQNIAPIPFLWVVPMALYLLTFVIAFANKRRVTSTFLARVAPLAVTPLLLPLVLEATEPLVWLGVLHLVTVFVLMLLCHTRLAEEAPPAERLTEFYLWVSVGGVLGGIFVAFVAPMIFTRYFEYPIALCAACFLRPARIQSKNPVLLWDVASVAGIMTLAFLGTWLSHRVQLEGIKPETAQLMRNGLSLGLPAILTFFASDQVRRYALTIAAFFVAAKVAGAGVPGQMILAKRSFFGIHRVLDANSGGYAYRTLVHGNTIHGRENLDRPLKPLTYYYPNGPIGQIFEQWVPANATIGMVGLGVGAQAYYGKPGQTMTYYEIDPAVIQIASDPKLFHFVSNCKAKLDIVPGDARLMLAKDDRKFDLLVLDAFSSDSVPMHLLTTEAIMLYRNRLKEHGIVAFHISNRYLSLGANLAAAAKANGMVAYYQYDVAIQSEEDEGKTPSQWMILARKKEDFGPLMRKQIWDEVDPGDIEPWRDDFSNLLEAFLRKRTEESSQD